MYMLNLHLQFLSLLLHQQAFENILQNLPLMQIVQVMLM